MAGVTSTTTTATETEVVTTSEEQSSETITTTRTTTIEGEPSTVIVTLTITRYPSVEPTTKTTTEIVTATETESETETETETETDTSTRTATETATGEPPWRPTVTSESGGGDTQTGCPTGFYGCLATHGGGCCRTDRNCETHSCPAPSSTTVVSNGVTIVVPADNVPTAASTCADGWFLCGDSGGPVPGCCPRGYECATASCYNETVAVQKELPDNDASPSVGKWPLLTLAAVGSAVMFLMV
jgi:progranulin